jgi:medium-chain acyl-[acyl-carrier-protein] hydrolase
VIGCETYWAVFNTKLRPTGNFGSFHMSILKKYPERLATEERVKKIDLPDSMKKIAERKVVLSDLDIVNHVNNVKYLEWCLDLVNPKSILKQQLKSFDMNFMKELVLGDEVAINETTDTNQSIFSITKNGKPCFALELNWK